jgi:hypothetical protein
VNLSNKSSHVNSQPIPPFGEQNLQAFSRL